MSATNDNPRFTKPSKMPETIELGGILYELHSRFENCGKEGGPPEYIDFRYYLISENKK